MYVNILRLRTCCSLSNKVCSLPFFFLTFSVSKQHSVVPSQIFELEDGTSSYKDFAMSKNNRFTSAGQASKNIIQPPSCVLHYYNVPLCVTEETFTKVGTEIQIVQNVLVLFFKKSYFSLILKSCSVHLLLYFLNSFGTLYNSFWLLLFIDLLLVCSSVLLRVGIRVQSEISLLLLLASSFTMSLILTSP